MVKRKDFLYDEERERIKRKQKAVGVKVENHQEAWEEGIYDSRTGTVNKQAMDAPYKYHGRWEWWEGDSFLYGYRKKTAVTRKHRNAKAKKPKGKRYYQKARNSKEIKTPNLSYKVQAWLDERDEHTRMMVERGLMPYATCKGCRYPLHFKFMDNFDMALCHDCSEGLRDEEWVKEMTGDEVII